MEDNRIKEEIKKIIKQRREEGWKVVCCRLCGETWFYPPYYTDDKLKDFECNICRGRIVRGY